MAQAERELRRRITGNVTLYVFLHKHRERRFLQRNIENALRYHAERGRCSRRPITPSNRTPVANSSVLSKSKPEILDQEAARDAEYSGTTSRETAGQHGRGEALDEIIGRIMPSSEDSLPDHFYKIELKSLKRKRTAGRECLESIKQPPSKRMKSKLTRCRCELRILGKGLRDDSMKLLFQDRQFCNLSRVLGGDGDTLAEIDLVEKAFFVKADRLLEEAERGDHRTQTLLDHYTIEISFTSTGSPGWPPEPFESEFTQSCTGSQHPLRLSSTFDDLPHCPQEKILLDVEGSFSGGPSIKSTEAELEIVTAWSRPPPPKLPVSLVQKQGSDIERGPAPKAQVRYLIGPTHYENGTKKKKKVVGYGCIFCENRRFRAIELLHFHLLTCHDNFKYKVNARRSHERRARWDIHMDIADYRGSNDDDEDERDMRWVRPKRPFILSRYLKGDDSWVTGKSPLPTPPPAPPQLSRSTSSARNSQTRQAPGAPTIIDPNTVPDLPKPKTKKFAVPPDGRYYRSLTKRRLKEGEMLSESDDDVDESWLIQKHKETIDDFADVFGAEKTFMKRFDQHMLRENLCAQRYVPSSLIRFCRANREWLNTTDMLVEFWKQSLYLAQHGIINAAHVKTCIDIIHGKEAGRSRVRLGNGFSKMAVDAHVDSPLVEKAHGSTTLRHRSAQDSPDAWMDIDDIVINDVNGSIRTEDEQIDQDVQIITHGDAQQDQIRTVPQPQHQQQQQQAQFMQTPNKDTGYAGGEYVNTALCHGGCGEWKRSDLIICENRAHLQTNYSLEDRHLAELHSQRRYILQIYLPKPRMHILILLAICLPRRN
ncbi:hypothetical protein GP486_000582 [Trichoglossum hirsutum]|uniref:Polycomb protein VEFS-Box domain-containing protein n=1 Tax=Trichoglossum hirsutum TaxID=265104 RepID=A0A9P8LIB3_9PEZI|nr:hypothetical protein GP486_000582 [Trichoglossum hirsutum]